MFHAAKNFPATGFVDIVQLLGRCAIRFTRGPRSFSFGSTFQDWMAARRTGSENVVLHPCVKKFLLVAGRGLTAHILSQFPAARGCREGMTKSRAMLFLASQALTLTHGEQWQRLRNE